MGPTGARLMALVVTGLLVAGGQAATLHPARAATDDAADTRTLEMAEAGIAVTFPAVWRLWSPPASGAGEPAVVASDVSGRRTCTLSLMADATSAQTVAQQTYDAVAANKDLEVVGLDVFVVPAGEVSSVSYGIATAPDDPRAVRHEYYVTVPGGVVSVSCGGGADRPADDYSRHVLDGLTLLPAKGVVSAPFDPRVVVPESGFAVDFPAQWLVRAWVGPGPLLGGGLWWRALTLGDDETDGYECIAEDASSVPELADVRDLDDWQAALAAYAEGQGGAEPILVLTDLELLSGPVPRADREEWRGMPASAWLFRDEDRHVALLCRSDDPPADRWRSVAETFEFLPPPGDRMPFEDYLLRLDELQSASDAVLGQLGAASTPSEVAAAFDEVITLGAADLQDLRAVQPAICYEAAHESILTYRSSVIELIGAALPAIDESATLDEVFAVIEEIDVALHDRHPTAYTEAPGASPGFGGSHRHILAALASCEPPAAATSPPGELAARMPRELGGVALTTRVMTGADALEASEATGSRSLEAVLATLGKTSADLRIVQAFSADLTSPPAYVINAFHVEGVDGVALLDRLWLQTAADAGVPPDEAVPLESIGGRSVWPVHRGSDDEWSVIYPSGDLLVMAVGIGGLTLPEALAALP